MKQARAPWSERARYTRALADLCLGCYPRFTLRLGLSRNILPVFHFHEVDPGYLRPCLDHLLHGNYHTLRIGEFLDVLAGRTPLRPRSVFLTFDDAWASVWTVAAPLLAERGQHATTFAIPGRVSREPGLRTQFTGEDSPFETGDRSDEPFARWDELRALRDEGVVEAAAHTHAHEQVPVGPATDTWTATAIESTPLLSRPVVREGDAVRPIDTRETGQPRHPTRPRMSEVRAWTDAEQRIETPDEARNAIRSDLESCRDKMAGELGTAPTLLCFPWAVSGPTAREEARRAGYQAAFADHFPGRRCVRPGDSPFRLMRLKHQWILKLPPLHQR